MSRILLTGARGFLGAPLLERLAATGDEIVAVTSGPPPAGGPAGVTWRHADLRDGQAAAALAADVRADTLVHLAWGIVAPGYAADEEANGTWRDAGALLIRAALDAGAGRVVVTGTCAEYDPAAPAPWDDAGGTPIAPVTAYARAKAALHEHAAEDVAAAGAALAWARPFFVFGPREPPVKLVRSVAEAALAGRPAPITTGRTTVDFIHVDDAAAMLAAIVASPVTGAVNVCSGAPVTVADLAALVCAAAGRPDLLRIGALADPPAGAPVIAGTVARLRDEVGAPPARPLAATVAETVDALRG